MKASLLYPLVAFIISLFATSFIYSGLIIPRLPSVHSVSMLWWLGCSLPVIAVAFYFGWVAKNATSIVKVSVSGVASYIIFLQFNGQNFHGIPEGSTQHYMQLLTTSFAVFICMLILVSLGYILNMVWRVTFA